MDTFRIDPSSVEHDSSAGAIVATASIVDAQNVVIGYIVDRAESIRASVEFVSDAARAQFIDEARIKGCFDQHNNAYLISEYARRLLDAAEFQLLENVGRYNITKE